MALTRYKILHKSGGNTTVNSGSSTNVSVNTSSGTEYFNRYFYWDAEHESVHCRYSLVGDYEVSAFGYGSSSGSGGGGGGGDVDLSDYVTYEFLSSQSYLQSASMNNYVTKQELSNMGYVTNSTLNNYVTKTSLSQMGYVTNSALSQMGYLTQSDVSNMGYITQAAMDATLSGYVKMSYLNEQFAFTANQITALKNLVGNGEISAFGSGSSSGGGGEGTSVEVVDDLTHHSNADRYKALSAYQGYVLDKKIDELPTMSTLASYVTQNQLDAAAYVTSSSLNTIGYVTRTVLNNILTTSYVKKTDLNTTLTSYVKKSDLNTTLTSYVKKSDLNTTLTSYAKAADLTALAERVETLEDYVNDLLWINDHLSIGISDGITYLYCKIPIVSTGEIEAYK